MMVVSALFLILQEALTSGVVQPAEFRDNAREVWVLLVFSVVCWVFKFAVFSDGTNS